MGHITPEPQESGPITLVQTDDKITIDAKNRTINMDLSDEEIGRRRTA